MKHENELNIVRDHFGNIDINYYEAQARRMRSEAFVETGLTLGRVLRRSIGRAGAALSHFGHSLQDRGTVSRQA